jgi:hypothetical protein
VAELTIGIGMSHGPLVVCEAPTWLRIGELDHTSTLLRDITTGDPITFEELSEANGERFAERATLEHLEGQCRQVKRSLARLREEFAQAAPDVVVVIGDDQFELFDHDNLPALAVYYGEELISCTHTRRGRYGARVGGLDDVHKGYGMDEHRRWPGHAPLAEHLISSLIDRHFDVSAVRGISDPARGGIGHAFGVVEVQLMDEPKRPLVPVFVNTYWPPNQLPPARCYELGLALREAIDAYPEDLRVALVASGGLSHFVTDEELDRQTLEALRAGDAEALCRLPLHRLNSGNSEVRNWIVVAAACQEERLAWDDYIPVYRTPAGTGCGLTFARWGMAA